MAALYGEIDSIKMFLLCLTAKRKDEAIDILNSKQLDFTVYLKTNFFWKILTENFYPEILFFP
jgi:hypothetical protein